MSRLSILLLALIGCLRVPHSVNQSPSLEDIAMSITSDKNLACSCTYIIIDSTNTVTKSWFEDPDMIQKNISYEIYDELIKSYRLNNLANRHLAVGVPKSKVTSESPTIEFSNYGVSQDGKYVLIYFKTHRGNLYGEGAVRIYELDSKLKIKSTPILELTLWRS